MEAPQLTLYTLNPSPYCQRVELALLEAGANYSRHEIDLNNKPEWFTSQVTAIGKVPAMTIGGPIVPSDQPSPDSAKVWESLVLLELIAELFPSSTLMPNNPILKAKVRLFIDALSNQLVPPGMAAVFGGAPIAGLLTGVEAVQALLSDEGLAVGKEFTIADAAILPLLVKLQEGYVSGTGTFGDVFTAEGDGRDAREELKVGARFERIRKYTAELMERESCRQVFSRL